MIFHENRLLAEDSHEISYLIFVVSQNLSSAAVVAGALRVNLPVAQFHQVEALLSRFPEE